jgi:hypothetical protein
MVRPFEGRKHLEAARALRDKAKAMPSYRRALAVLLALERPLSLGETDRDPGLIRGSGEPDT